MSALLPRLSPLGVEIAIDALAAGTTSSVDGLLLRHISYGATGGVRATGVADDMAAGIRCVAAECGFPDNGSQVARAKFDREAAIFLAAMENPWSGELLRDDVWAYIACCRVADVVAWRFPDRSHSRFAGGVRYAFQRLWTRGVTLDRGPDALDRWALVRTLSEDAAVAIFERPALASRQRLVVAIAEGWSRTAARIGRERMEAVMRRTVKVIRLRNEIVDLERLSDVELANMIGEIFNQAVVHEKVPAERSEQPIHA